MSKKLDSILVNYPKATVAVTSINEKTKIDSYAEKITRINVEAPLSIKIQIKEYIAKNPGETEKTIVLKALKSFGFQIENKYLSDLRGKN